eukprot:scaffold1554_cov401-Prasinococcus_capsulatus_cf.AAC.9
MPSPLRRPPVAARLRPSRGPQMQGLQRRRPQSPAHTSAGAGSTGAAVAAAAAAGPDAIRTPPGRQARAWGGRIGACTVHPRRWHQRCVHERGEHRPQPCTSSLPESGVAAIKGLSWP